MIVMTRKDQMREGYVARAFHIPIDVDDELRMEAVKNRVRFSDVAILAIREHLAKHPNPAAVCPGIPGSKTEIESSH